MDPAGANIPANIVHQMEQMSWRRAFLDAYISENPWGRGGGPDTVFGNILNGAFNTLRIPFLVFEHTAAALANPLLRAIGLNDRNGVKEALSRGFSANMCDVARWTPLHEAAINDSRVECLEELLRHESANVNAVTFHYITPLHLACLHKCVNIVKLLLSYPKCDLNKTVLFGLSPLHIACFDMTSNKNCGLHNVQLLLNFLSNEQERTEFNGCLPSSEWVSFGKGHINKDQDEKANKICALIVSHGAQIDCEDSSGNLAIHYACQHGFLKCVEFFHSGSGERNLINRTNNYGQTPLMVAAGFRNEAIVEMLLSNGANADIEGDQNLTALIFAAHSSNYGIFNQISKATSQRCVIKTCTFDEERDVDKVLSSRKNLHSLVCYAIGTKDLQFLNKVLVTDIVPAALHCPVVYVKHETKPSLILHSPISFLLEGKMHVLGDETIQFLQTLIDHGSPLKMTSRGTLVSYVNPICAALDSLKYCSPVLVMKCLKILLSSGADPDEPPGKIPYPMQQACRRGCVDAVLLLLQYSNIIEPQDLINWIEKETNLGPHGRKIIDTLLPLAPHCYTSSSTSHPQVYPLTSWCRAAVRQQLHEETKQSPVIFKEYLKNLPVPKDLLTFLQFM